MHAGMEECVWVYDWCGSEPDVERFACDNSSTVHHQNPSDTTGPLRWPPSRTFGPHTRSTERGED